MHSLEYKISVVIPCYKASETIEKCISSVQKQTFTVHEIIAVNDGSPDNTLEILEKIERNSQLPLKIISQKNSGPSVARNTGMQNATGNWIAFLDCDDFWAENKTELQVEALNRNPSWMMIGAKNTPNNSSMSISLNQLLLKNYFQTSATLLKKSVAVQFLFNENQRYSEDYRTWLQIAAHYKVGIVGKELAFAISGKMAFGVSGLSSKLWEMQKGEISNFNFLKKNKKIGFFDHISAVGLSYLKYFRRLMITKLKI